MQSEERLVLHALLVRPMETPHNRGPRTMRHLRVKDKDQPRKSLPLVFLCSSTSSTRRLRHKCLPPEILRMIPICSKMLRLQIHGNQTSIKGATSIHSTQHQTQFRIPHSRRLHTSFMSGRVLLHPSLSSRVYARMLVMAQTSVSLGLLKRRMPLWPAWIE